MQHSLPSFNLGRGHVVDIALSLVRNLEDIDGIQITSGI